MKKYAVLVLCFALVCGISSTQGQSQNRQPQAIATGNPFVGTWKKVAKDGGQMLTDVLIIERTGDGTIRIREKKVMDNTEFRNIVYGNGTIKGTLYMAVDTEWTTPFVITMSGKNSITYKDQRGEETFIHSSSVASSTNPASPLKPQHLTPPEMTPEEAFFYKAAIYGAQDNIVDRYASYFDANNYKQAVANEFLRKQW